MTRGAYRWGLLTAMLGASLAFAADSEDREIPEPFVPFEHMVGSWKGTGVPSANRLKGWAETHMWAWKFAKGNPVGMTIELTGDKTLAKGQLTYDADAKQYRLEATDAAGKPATYLGALDKAGKALVLNREGAAPAGGKDRVVIRPNSNLIRYIMEFDHQEAGAPQFKRVIEVGLTKEGESFAAGGSAADLPKCILTGGAATMSVTYQGKSYPICCSGCRDEFNENPEKYAKKAALLGEAGGGKTPVKTATAKAGKDDGSFEGMVDDEKPKKPLTGKPARATGKTKAAVALPDDDETAPATGAETAKNASTKAASQLRLAQGLEKSGKTAAALKYYRQIVKDYPSTPQAKTAATRIKALSSE